ncbi:hypothetical protein B566_EDAN010977 [Ephemera danica]|nr:hypothetical protein B566_EDAN010977 [Ephemera danica]
MAGTSQVRRTVLNEDLSNVEFETSEDVEVIPTFDSMGLREELLRGIYAYGFEKPSAIQQRSIKPIVKGRDVIAQAQSGTGKTATFSVSILQSLDTQLRETQVLCLSPTRELAVQIQKKIMDIEDETVENEEMDAEYEDIDSDSANQNNVNDSENGESSKEKVARKVYLPGQSLQSDEELVCDESAYIMLHQAKTGAPCLSFDIIPDSLGNNRDTFPMTSFLVAGTQGEGKNLNHIIVIKMSNLFKTQKTEKEEESSDSESDSDDNDDTAAPKKTPRLDCTLLPHKGCINRVRASTIGGKVLTASWSELGVVNIWDVTDNLRKLGALRPSDPVLLERIGLRDQPKPLHSFKGHQGEGFAVDWCNTIPGMLATGDCARNIHIWTPKENAAGWIVNQVPLKGHTASVEDVQWSPNEKHVLASCSVDCSLEWNDLQVILALGDYMNVQCHACIGGTNLGEDIRKLDYGQHVVSGTPGRVFDMIRRRVLRTRSIKMLVLDEADEMLNKGFKEQIYDVYRYLPPATQVKVHILL